MEEQQTNYLLTPSQIGMASLHEFYSDTSVATLCGVVIFEEQFPADLIDDAIRSVIRRHDALRLRITRVDGTYIQTISDYEDEDVEHVFLESEAQTEEFGLKEGRRIFDTNGEKMYHFTVLDLPDRTAVCVSSSHIITDSWAYSIIVREVYSYCMAVREGREPAKEVLSYLNYINRTLGYTSSSVQKDDISFWEDKYKDGISTGSIGHIKDQDYKIDSSRYSTYISREVSEKIKAFISSEKSSVSVIFESAVLIYLARTSNVSRNVTIGTPVLGRSGVAEKETIGMFMSTIPLSVDVESDQSASSLCDAVSKTHRSIFRHSRLSHDEIARSIRSSCGYSGRLYNVLVNYQNSRTDVPSESVWFSNGYTEVPLAIHLDDRDGNDRIRMLIDHQLEAWSEEEIVLLGKRIEHIIDQFVTNPGIKIKDISLLPEEEQDYLTKTFNNTNVSYRKDICVHEAFEEYAKANTKRTAVKFKGKDYTYGDLSRMSDSLAACLKEKGIGREDTVPIISIRSIYTIVAMLAVLKTGASYMFISPDYPLSRISYMTDIVEAELVLCCGYNCEFKEAIDLDAFDYSYKEFIREDRSDVSDVCYVMFTSGSTGKPKALCISHQNVMNYCACNDFNICGAIIKREEGCILSVTNIIFDIFVTESILALLNGIPIMLADDDQVMSGKALSELIREGADIIQTTPTRMRSYLLDKDFKESISRLKAVILGGEALPESLAASLLKETDAKLYNVYGPAETTVWSTLSRVEDKEITIGKPVANTKVYIMDEDMSLCPIGIEGQIVISGDGVGKGYINNPELSAEKFVRDPWAAGNTMYLTGDMGYLGADGSIIFCGRRDGQIKLRGQRIETGEIECAITDYEGVDLAAVVLRTGDNDKQFLAAFYTSSVDLSEAELKEYLVAKLPGYMVPGRIVRLEQMPLTASGKTDRKSLPEVSFCDDRQNEYVEASTEEEKRLCQIARDVLKISEVGVSDDLFELGMDSLAAMDFVSSAADKGMDITIKELYSARNIRQLALAVSSAEDQSEPSKDHAKYPMKLKPSDRVLYKLISFITRHIYRFEVEGLENISPDSKFIFCPNHASMADPLWVWTALGKKLEPADIATMAAEEFLESRFTRKIFRINGSIPVDRRGDFSGSLKRAEEVIKNERQYLLIHPEGTRTRSGELGEFKKGAAVTALASGVAIIPVYIKGAGDIFPVGRRFPKIYDFKNRRKFPLKICFGKSIPADGQSAEELTEAIKKRIEQMRDTLY